MQGFGGGGGEASHPRRRRDPLGIGDGADPKALNPIDQ